MPKYEYLIVGSGLYGSVFAHCLFKAGKKVKVIEKRSHIAGNCYSYFYEDTNIIVHKYGTHIFHTNNKETWDFFNRFSSFNNYQHKVLTQYNDKVYSMPINLDTINAFYGINLKPHEVDSFLIAKRGKINTPRNFEEKAISLIGEDLYEAFIKGYTIKQWQRDPKELPASIINRLPVRSSYFDNYFDDLYQGVPVEGYTPLFEKMLFGIPVELNIDYFDDRSYWNAQAEKIVYTGPIDRYFDFSAGALNWRSVRFEVEKMTVDDFQGTAVMNFSNVNIPYTRIHEPKHLHRERKIKDSDTVVIHEYPHTNDLEPYYPVNTEEDRRRYSIYKNLALEEKNVIFGGRLAQYKYFDMHHVITAALAHSAMELK